MRRTSRNAPLERQTLSSSQRVVESSVRDQYQPMGSRSINRENHSNLRHQNNHLSHSNSSSVNNLDQSEPDLNDPYTAECWSMWKTIEQKSRAFLTTATSSGELNVSTDRLVHTENSGTAFPVPRRTLLRARNTEDMTGESPLYQNANRVNYQSSQHNFGKPRYFDQAVCAAVPRDGDYSDLIIDAMNNERNIVEFVNESSLEDDHGFNKSSYIDRPIKGIVDYRHKIRAQSILKKNELSRQYLKNNRYYGGDLHLMPVGEGKEYLTAHGRHWTETFKGIKARGTGFIKGLYTGDSLPFNEFMEKASKNQKISVASIGLPFKNKVLTAQTIEDAYEHILSLHAADGLFFREGQDPRELTFVNKSG